MPLWTLPSRRGTSWHVPSTSSLALSGVTVTAGGTPHVKTAYSQITASTSGDWLGFWVYFDPTNASATDTSTLMDVAVGGSGSEQVIVANLPIGYKGNIFVDNFVYIPLYIPNATRVAVRMQSAATLLDRAGVRAGMEIEHKGEVEVKPASQIIK